MDGSPPVTTPSVQEIRELIRLGYRYSAPYAQWDYPHLIGSDGGILPWYPGILDELDQQARPTEGELIELQSLGWTYYKPVEGMPKGYLVNFRTNAVKPYDERSLKNLTPLPPTWLAYGW